MKYVITDHNGIIAYIADRIGTYNGDLIADNTAVFISGAMDTHEADIVPPEVEPIKYCYTNDGGFAVNQAWLDEQARQPATKAELDAALARIAELEAIQAVQLGVEA